MYSWIHAGICGCAEQLFKGEETDKYVTYIIQRLETLIECGVKPYCVFDGRDLPSKLSVEEERQARRAQTRKDVERMIERGESGYYFKMVGAIDVTPAMARKVIRAVKEKGFDYVVAPYEADAQMAYLAKEGIVDFVISEDSDLVVFGVQKILFKLKFPNCRGSFFDGSKISKCLGEKFADFDRFRNFCILTGCDYLKGLPQIGIKRALEFFKITECSDLRKALKRIYSYLKLKTALKVSDEYIDEFFKAINTFKHQLVFCPKAQKLVPLYPYENGYTHEQFPYAGEMLDDELAVKLAQGLIDLDTLQPVELIPSDGGDTTSVTLSTTSSQSSNRSSSFYYSASKNGKRKSDGEEEERVVKQKTESKHKETKQVTIEFNESPTPQRKRLTCKSVFKKTVEEKSSSDTEVISKYFSSEVDKSLVDQYKVKQKMDEIEDEAIQKRTLRSYSQSTRSSVSSSQGSVNGDATPSTVSTSSGSLSQAKSQDTNERTSNIEKLYASRSQSSQKSTGSPRKRFARNGSQTKAIGDETPSEVSSASESESEEEPKRSVTRARVRV